MEKRETLTERRNRNGVEYRGRIINRVINLEKAIEVFIVRYFTETVKKQEQLHFLILGDNRMNLDSKIQVFVSLAKNEYSKWYNSYTSPRNELKKKYDLHKDLNFIILNRNILAHAFMTNDSVFESNSTSLYISRRLNTLGDDVVYFNKFMNINKEYMYNKKQIDDLSELIHTIFYFIINQNEQISNEKKLLKNL